MAITERLEWQRKASEAGVAKVPRSRFCQHALKKSRSQCPYALNQRSPAEGKGKGQKLLAQGIALGFRTNTKCRPERAKALKIPPFCNISVKVLDLHQEIGAF